MGTGTPRLFVLAAMHEIHSFMNKFFNLFQSGENADLTLMQERKNGDNLQLDLDS